jgi:hypothetical protein
MVLGSGTDRALRELPTASRVVASEAEVQCGNALGQRAGRQKTTNLSSIPPIRRRHPIWPPAPPRFFTDVGFLPPRGSAIRVATRSTRRRRQQLRPPSPSCPGLLCLSAFVQDDGTLRSEHMLPALETSAAPTLAAPVAPITHDLADAGIQLCARGQALCFFVQLVLCTRCVPRPGIANVCLVILLVAFDVLHIWC